MGKISLPSSGSGVRTLTLIVCPPDGNYYLSPSHQLILHRHRTLQALKSCGKACHAKFFNDSFSIYNLWFLWESTTLKRSRMQGHGMSWKMKLK
jgi:hypothetical protein